MLIIVLAVLLLAAVAVAVWAFLRPGTTATPTATPSVSATPTPTPTPTRTPTPTPTATSGGGGGGSAPQITNFTVAPTTVTCSTPAPAQPGFTSTPLSISWATTGASAVYLGVDTTDAQSAPYLTGLPGSGSNNSINFSCFDNHRYTLTIVGSDGTKVSKTITVTNNGDHP